jgi:hypothetical protein
MCFEILLDGLIGGWRQSNPGKNATKDELRRLPNSLVLKLKDWAQHFHKIEVRLFANEGQHYCV